MREATEATAAVVSCQLSVAEFLNVVRTAEKAKNTDTLADAKAGAAAVRCSSSGDHTPIGALPPRLDSDFSIHDRCHAMSVEVSGGDVPCAVLHGLLLVLSVQ
eukprot:678022-Amphidinium_carterae.1